jgi:phytoene desaturase
MNQDTVVVVGAGFGGLAAAIRLRAMGHRVVVLEATDQAGGRARVLQSAGFQFDAGPTVVTAPYLFEELFSLAGYDAHDFYELLPVDPFYRVAFADGSHFNYVGDQERLIAQIASFNPKDVDGYLKLAEQSRRIFEVGYARLADKPFSNLSDMVRIVPEMIRLESYRGLYPMVSRYLKDERLRQAFSFQPLLIGGNPFRVPAIYLLIHWVERRWGIHYPKGGAGRLVQAMVELLEKLGVEVRLNSPVSEIEVEANRVRAVVLENGERLPCLFAVCNADPSVVYTKLLHRQARDAGMERSVARRAHSMSLFVVYFATRRRYPDLAHHTIIMGPRYRELLRDIFDKKILADDFSLYLHRPGCTDPDCAPAGHDLFYALSPVPNLQSGLDWSRLAAPYQERIFDALEQSWLPGLRDNLVTSCSIDPRYFERTLRSYAGAAFGLEPRLSQSAYFRYHNQSKEFGGLYFVGAGVHPGAGLPGVLSSAKVLEKLVPRPSRPLSLPEKALSRSELGDRRDDVALSGGV